MVIGYLAAAAALAAAVLLRWLLDPLLGDFLPLATLYGAVAIAVWFGGYRPALLATVLGYLVCELLFVEPGIAFLSPRNLLGLVVYLLSCSIIIAFGEAMHRARRMAQERTALLVRRSEQLRALASEITVVEQRERRRVARILHDNLQQLIVAAKLRVAHLSDEDAGERQAEAARIMELLSECLTTCHTLTAELSPLILHQSIVYPENWTTR
jgi:signal transduction histidine kinase